MSRRLVTDAPETYDGFNTETAEWLDSVSAITGNRFRIVSIQDIAEEWQEQRYLSGGYVAMDEEEWRDSGWMIVNEDEGFPPSEGR